MFVVNLRQGWFKSRALISVRSVSLGPRPLTADENDTSEVVTAIKKPKYRLFFRILTDIQFLINRCSAT